MRSIKSLIAASSILMLLSACAWAAAPEFINLPDPAVTTVSIQDDGPEVTARVARISSLVGDVQVRRSGSDEWEQAARDLPLVEGDEITTGKDARLEIQLDSYTHIWLDGDSSLQFTTLQDTGIAISLPRGSAIVAAKNFEKDRCFIEIDAPSTTIAVQQSGTYRVDAGFNTVDTIGVRVTDGGEARVYSETAGFTLHSGRTARVFIAGTYAGEFDLADAPQFGDDLDNWTEARSTDIDRELANAQYDKFYDRDVWGAEDLSAYGEWIYTAGYGYVWRPYSTSVASYAGWTPYRYGTWRWVPPYGWTWVNDEPWGWATYHHGRWIYTDGYWAWTPYGAVRWARSWWSPALVYMTVYDSRICWYPLPYGYAYYDYNWAWHHRNGGHYNGGHNGGQPGGGHPGGGTGPTPTPTPTLPGDGTIATTPKVKVPPLSQVPAGGVVSVDQGTFGARRPGTKTPPLAVAQEVLKKLPSDVGTRVALPTIGEVDPRAAATVRTPKPKAASVIETIRTGAAVRQKEAPLDGSLRTTRILGDRKSVEDAPRRVPGTPVTGERPTGAVVRPPVRSEPVEPRATPPILPRPQPDQTPKYEPRPPTRDQVPVKETPAPRPQAPVRDTPKYDPPVRSQTPRYEPPDRPAPRADPPKSSPPPTRKEEPKKEAPPTRVEDRKSKG